MKSTKIKMAVASVIAAGSVALTAGAASAGTGSPTVTAQQNWDGSVSVWGTSFTPNTPINVTLADGTGRAIFEEPTAGSDGTFSTLFPAYWFDQCYTGAQVWAYDSNSVKSNTASVTAGCVTSGSTSGSQGAGGGGSTGTTTYRHPNLQ